MPFRPFAIAALLLISAAAPAAPATRPPPAAPPGPPVMFYVAKGAPDACGRGCDRWIAVEGQITSDAAGRFKQFIKRHLKDRHLPMYFSSPGGNLEQAIFIGNMLRELSAVARVARTIVKDCGFEAQTSDVCLKLKRSGRELAGELSTLSYPWRGHSRDRAGCHPWRAFCESRAAIQRRPAHQGDGSRGDAARGASRRSIAVGLCFQDGYRRRTARRCQNHQIRGHARPHP
jgi:hypothetical protein